MSYFGKNSMMCPHGDEDGKCGLCYDEWAASGIRNDPIGTFGEIEAQREAKVAPECIDLVERTRREVVAEFMRRSEARHKND